MPAFRLLLLLLCSPLVPAAAELAPGSTDCLQAVQGADVPRARTVCNEDNPHDAYNLALALYSGDPLSAVALLESAAAAGLAEAAHALGNHHLDRGQQDQGLAVLLDAAYAGLALAQYDYATALLEARPDALAEAVRWYGRAAAGGENAARYNLGVLILGHTSIEDRALWAWAWLSSMEAMDAHAEVARLASELASQMNVAERSRAMEILGSLRADAVSAALELATHIEIERDGEPS